MTLMHGTCVAVGEAAVLLRGPSGSGKSDLALRLIDAGGWLVADDQVALSYEDGAVIGRAPPTIQGFMEARGLGLVEVPCAVEARVALVVELVAQGEVARFPEPAFCEIVGVTLPLLRLAPFETSACAKIRLALRAAIRDRE